MRRHLTDAFWVVSGTALSALGTLVGIRVLTQVLAPGDYGAVSLAQGLSTLAISLVATPLTQAAIHYYPVLNRGDSTGELLASLRRCFSTAIPWILVGTVLAGIAYAHWSNGSPILVLTLLLLLASDCWRSANVSLLNAARRHRTYALWVAGDATFRPLLASLAVLALGSSPAVVLGAYLAVSVTLIVLFSRRREKAVPTETRAPASPEDPAALDKRMWAYALPLIPLGLIGWVSNLGDRYIIGALLGVADAGVYAAIYGLSSAPFMMVGGTVELALRPVHQAAVARGDHRQSLRMYRIWLITVAVVCGVGVLALAVGHRLVASYFVGSAYRYASDLMPWIGLGYAVRSVSYVFERMCYAYGQTRRVLVIQSWAVAATIVATPLGIVTLGLRGAAMAVPVYFSVQLAVAIVLALRTLKQSAVTGWSPVPGRVVPS
jgi:O-antigen/teichoic acid export membrane protein